MSSPAGDFIRASVTVRRPPAECFALFTRDIDLWWRRGPRFRHGAGAAALIHLEPREGGRVFESWKDVDGERAHEAGRVVVWEPPRRLAFSWRNATFAPEQTTRVEVEFEPVGEATKVTITHRGWSTIPADHPARHGQDVAAFQAMLGQWWGAQLSSLRAIALRPNQPRFDNPSP